MSIYFHSTLAILGGGGKAGRPLVAQALEAGYRVRVLLRHPEQFSLIHERLQIISGDARDPTALRNLLQGSDALLSTLGNPKGEPMPILSTVTAHLLTLLPELNIRRYIVVTGLYATGHKQQDTKTRQAADFMQRTFPLQMADRQRELDLLSASNLDWTCVRLPYVVEGVATGRVQAHLEHLPGGQITTEDLARFLLQQLDSDHYHRQAPFVANG